MQPDDGQIRTGYFPNRRYAACESLRFVHHNMCQAVFAFEREDLFSVRLSKPRLVPELDGSQRVADVFRQRLWRRWVLGEQAECLDIEYERLRGALGPER